MVYRMIAAAGLAAALGLSASAALADEDRTAAKIFRSAEDRVEYLDRTVDVTPRKSVRAHRRPRYHHAYHRHHPAAYPRRHFFVTGVSGYGYGPVNVATVTYRTYVYYTPYPSVSYGYPPYAHLYDLTHGPVYNKPCFC